jgi:sugar O-acyltransferase (sialic acid O-acetyltransferase NeuD family)
MRSFVLFGVGSAIVVDFVETCHRAGYSVVAGIKNHAAPSFLPDMVRLIELAEIEPELLDVSCLCPLFTPINRFKAVAEAKQRGFNFSQALIDPTTILASDVAIGGGSYVNAGTIVGAATTIAGNVIVNRGASVGHHGRIADFVSVGPGVTISGQVTIGRGAMIGAGATVGPRVEIGEHALVGAGAVVLADVPSHRKAFGIPATVVGKELDGFNLTRSELDC